MANPEHVKLVRAGGKALEEWWQRPYYEKNEAGVIVPISGVLDLRGAELSGTSLAGAKLTVADLGGADLRAADLAYANLSEANLRGADLSQADLTGADLSDCFLTDANLTGAQLSDANLLLADLSGANLSEAKCYNTIFANVDLSRVRGLESVDHLGPSTIGVDTLFNSEGKIPELFLRSAGVPDILITYLGSLTGDAFEFYTCFISFTERDDAFSQRLYDDLKAAGIRCWRWKEDARWGRALIGEVDQAIRHYDKLVVVISAAALSSEPVIREIERALQREEREKREVLFPIRLDDAVFSWDHALQPDVVRKFVGDFREWHEQARYDAALQRLVRDLKP
jgi:hypothetical protein